MFTVWMTYRPDAVRFEPPTRDDARFLARFVSRVESHCFAAEVEEMLREAGDEDMVVTATEWLAPEGAPTYDPSLFGDMVAHHLNQATRGTWEVIPTGGNCSALAPVYGWLGTRQVDVLVTDSVTAQAPDSDTEQITVAVHEYPNGDEISTHYAEVGTCTPEGVAQTIRETFAAVGVTA